MVIFTVNKRFRVRIKELLEWQLKSDSANIPGVTVGISKHNRMAMPHQMCERGTIEEPAFPPPLPINI